MKLIQFLLLISMICKNVYLTGSSMVDTSSLHEGDRAYMSADAQAVKVLQQKYPIKCVGTGVSDQDGLVMLALSLRATGEVDMSYARDLLIKITNDYVNILNSIPNLRPFMKQYPFDKKNVEIRLFFYKKDGYQAHYPYISVASAIKGNIFYKIKNENNDFGYKEIYSETYEEALEKLKLNTF